MDLRTITELKAIADEASHAAEFPAEETRGLDCTYEALRTRAQDLNAEHGWAQREVFETMFPDLAAQTEIAELETAAVAATARSRQEGVEHSLLELAGWTTGIRLALDVGA